MHEALKRLVWDRALNCCEYCRLPQSLDVLPFQIDHVIAEQHHGPTVAENLALSCLNELYDPLYVGSMALVSVAAHRFARGCRLYFFSITNTPQGARKDDVPSKRGRS